MAVVSPFAAIRYDARQVGGLDKVLTQPYDKITPEMQQVYWQRSPYNLAYILKGKAGEGDSPTDNVYTRASAYLQKWREQGVLLQRKRPALYAYSQEFHPPGASNDATLVRRGFIGLGNLESYDSRVVFRHELTHSGPKLDRLELLRATRAHFGQIFMVYSDPGQQIDRLLRAEAAKSPAIRVTDDFGVIHSLWDIDGPEQVQAIQHAMSDKQLIIADGHHRYETALAFQRECRASRPHEGPSDCSKVMMTFINMESKGILVLPTHRVLSGIPEFSSAGFLSRAARYFTGREYAYSGPDQRRSVMQRLRADMTAASAGGMTAIGALFADQEAFYLLQLREGVDRASLLPELSPAQRSLDVTILHQIVFHLCLKMDEEAVRDEKWIAYVREFEEGVEKVAGGKAQACFFLNPVKLQQVRDVALEGRVLPQKSTDFYPKLLSGLTIYQLES
ncbi:MAG: DUF1015 domain-containing protein [Acidobacteria bacterium]|nr:DUF1015 domain-containing protein [Acidobacteriota bacterium]